MKQFLKGFAGFYKNLVYLFVYQYDASTCQMCQGDGVKEVFSITERMPAKFECDICEGTGELFVRRNMWKVVFGRSKANG